MRFRIAAAVLLFVCSCKKKDEPPPPPPAVVEVKQPVVEAAPAPAPEPAPVAPARGDATAAFEADCAHVVMAKYDDMGEGGEKPECESRDFEQNCAPDTDGCWDAEEKCKDGCSTPCGDCQAACTTTCADCKAMCERAKDKPACIHTCAAARETCRQSCLTGLDTCRDKTCPAQATACSEAAEQKRTELCPDCTGIKGCLGTGFYGQAEQLKEPDWDKRAKKTRAACATEFPDAKKECFQLCEPEP